MSSKRLLRDDVSEMAELSEIEHDALTEITNLAIGRSAGVLNEMIGQEVTLSVPQVIILEQSKLAGHIGGIQGKDLTLVQQGFDGPLSGLASIAFPEQKSLELVRLLLGEEMSLEEIVELEQEALQEMGNVILNSFLGTFGNEFNVNISSEIPKFYKNVEVDGLIGDLNEQDVSVVFIHVDFCVKEENIDGYLVLAVTIPTMEKLVELVKNYVESLG